MLTIKTTNNQVLISKDNGPTRSYAKNELNYSFDDIMLFVSTNSGKNLYSEAFSNGLTLNGEPVTSTNITQKMETIFRFCCKVESGVCDYNELDNKLYINGVLLEGDKTEEDYGLASKEDVDIKADNYYTEEVIKVSDINVDIDMGGKTLIFDTSKDFSWSGTSTSVLFENGSSLFAGASPTLEGIFYIPFMASPKSWVSIYIGGRGWQRVADGFIYFT